MAHKLKVHELLDRQELDELEEFAREPGRTIDQCHEWLQARGYTLSRNAVFNWKSDFDLTDKFKSANAAAQQLIGAAAQEKGTIALSDAAMLKLTQMIFEQMLRMQAGEDVAPKELWGLSVAIKNVVEGKRHIEKLKGEMADALKLAEKDAKAGASGEQVVDRVREILGIAA